MENLEHHLTRLTRAIEASTEQRNTEFEWRRSHSEFATKQDLDRMEHRMSSKIADFAAAQANFNTRQGAAIDQVVAATAGITADVQALKDKIQQLQDSAGQITPEDQALLDQVQTQAEAVSNKLEQAGTALKGLDDATPPVVPAVPPGT